MRILLTGSSGWLGRALAPRLRVRGHEVVGLDPIVGPDTTVLGSVADRAVVRAAIGDFRVEAILHAGALHKPDMDRRGCSDFVSVNVAGTLNLLEEAVAQRVERFVFTSTTSLMVSERIRAGPQAGRAGRNG